MNEQNTFEDQAVAWTPSKEVVERAQLTRFMKQTGTHNFDEVYANSIASPEEFTKNVLEFLNIEFNPPYTKLLDTSDGIKWSKWCVGGGLNITEMCVDRWAKDETTANQPAIIWEGEEGEVKTLSYQELLAQIEYCAAGLRANGLQKGDAIGIHLPMIIETVVALLAINRIGAIAVPVFSGYGVDAIASRVNAVKAKALITCDGFFRRGKAINALQTALQAVATCEFIEKVFIVEESRGDFAEEYQKRRLIKDTKSEEQSAKAVKNQDNNKYTEADFKLIFVRWDYLIQKGQEFAANSVSIEPTLAEDPLIILYTSGTTGKPKGIAHTHCGFPIKAAQDMAFGTDVGVGTRISWVTDLGWMMGPWLIYGALINGATICIYDGAPDYPAPDRMWEFAAKHKVEILGISPTLVRSLARSADTPVRTFADADKNVHTGINAEKFVNAGDEEADRSVRAPHQIHDLSALRAFASTGEPWNPAPWWWLFEKVGNSKLPIINYSGGTEISGGILMGNPLLPIKPCSFPAPCLGIDVGILDDRGKQVAKGTVGELSIRQPWIGMARGFWQEPERYVETYWNRFAGIWVHGDWAMQDADGHYYILGRSDDTLKVAGKRVGPAEVESLLVAHERVAEAAVIGIPDEIKGTAMIAFVVLKTDADILSTTNAKRENQDEQVKIQTNISALNNDVHTNEPLALQTELKQLVAKDMGKPLAPSKIYFVSALPKTRNAKVMRRVIRSAFLGEDAGDLSALENPQAIVEIANAAQD